MLSWLALLSTALMSALTLPLSWSSGPFNTATIFSLLGWVAFVPLLLLLKPNRGRQNFIFGFTAALLSNLLVLHWITHSMIQFGQLNSLTSFAILTLLSLYLSLFNGAWCWYYGRLAAGRRRPWVGAAAWMLMEYLRAYLLGGFPWCNLGYGQARLENFIQASALIGTFGLGFVVIGLNLAIREALPLFPQRNAWGIAKATLPMALLFSALCIYGEWQLRKPAEDHPKTLSLRLVQASIPQDEKWEANQAQKILDRFHELSKRGDDVELILWPEASYPFSIDYQTPQIPGIRLSAAASPHLLMGAASRIPASHEVMNSMFLTNAQGAVQGRYDKIRLVMYGEYVPLAKWAPIRKLARAVGHFKAGTLATPFEFIRAEDIAKIAPLICYEVIYPDLARRQVQGGAEMLVNATNDAWFGETSGPFQHLQIARFRAIENHRYLARAANTGISAIITPNGRLISQLNLNEVGQLNFKLPLLSHRTLYNRTGDLPWLILALAGLVILTRKL